MLTRREILIGSSCAIATRTAHARAEADDDGFVVLRATANGYDGILPGPLIRVRRDAEVKARLVNALGEPTAVHWHGVRLPNPMDGAPPLTQPAVAPGASFDYRFIVPDAGTFWYHAPGLSPGASGLYGALIVEEREPPPVDRDHLIVLADAPAASPPAGLAANGEARLDLGARSNQRLRLRFVNASARALSARIDNHNPFVVALDGQPAEPFVPRDGRIVLGPGNRVDALLDATLAPGSIAAVVFESNAAAAPTVRIVYDDAGPARVAALGEPAPLPGNPLPQRMNFSRALRATLPLGAPDVPAALSDRPLFAAGHGRTVVMALDNRTAAAHAVHIHGHHFRLLDRLDDGWKPYWLDTILVPAGQIARIAFVADNPGRWLIEDRPLDGYGATGSWFQIG